jgi:hypothetical protein
VLLCCSFSTFPEELFGMHELVELNLAENQLRQLPETGWGTVKSLQVRFEAVVAQLKIWRSSGIPEVLKEY